MYLNFHVKLILLNSSFLIHCAARESNSKLLNDISTYAYHNDLILSYATKDLRLGYINIVTVMPVSMLCPFFLYYSPVGLSNVWWVIAACGGGCVLYHVLFSCVGRCGLQFTVTVVCCVDSFSFCFIFILIISLCSCSFLFHTSFCIVKI